MHDSQAPPPLCARMPDVGILKGNSEKEEDLEGDVPRRTRDCPSCCRIGGSPCLSHLIDGLGACPRPFSYPPIFAGTRILKTATVTGQSPEDMGSQAEPGEQVNPD